MKTPVARGVWSGVGAGALGVAWRKDREKKCLTIFVPAVWSELGLNGRQTRKVMKMRKPAVRRDRKPHVHPPGNYQVG
ncbi:hypothetical protein Cadr_000010631 [Camelus dromedarius]|uniref:Uncharacterized protein n=1 Tax=Camelus dromedarius TaxID=9838 RepID=A0A5N4DX10_CAMDR|nr:hypothetical protein Cadr_000010631 [Camelus dromedarius]KAB1275682.1 hypothetical protein Cadr_000010631 [Camelus dromedarius]